MIGSDGAEITTRWSMPYELEPKFLQMETVIICNAECPFCPQHLITRNPPKMPDWLWKKIIDDTRGMGIVYRPFLANEPFVDKRMPEIMRYIRQDPTAKIEFNTNGSLLNDKLNAEILEIGIDVMRLSIDGFSHETYAPSRVGLQYEHVLERSTRFLEMWREGGYEKNCHTEVRMIGMPENAHEHDDYRAYWEPLCSEVLITELYRWPWDGQEDSVRKPCFKVTDAMYFFSTGEATLCCWDIPGRGIIGDARTHSVMEIWNSAQFNAARTILNDGRRDLLQLCSRCDAYESHDFSEYEVNPPREAPEAQASA